MTKYICPECNYTAYSASPYLEDEPCDQCGHEGMTIEKEKDDEHSR